MTQLGELQALIAGTVAGALMKASSEDGHLLINVEFPTDQDGNYGSEILVIGRESGERVLIRVEESQDV